MGREPGVAAEAVTVTLTPGGYRARQDFHCSLGFSRHRVPRRHRPRRPRNFLPLRSVSSSLLRRRFVHLPFHPRPLTTLCHPRRGEKSRGSNSVRSPGVLPGSSENSLDGSFALTYHPLSHIDEYTLATTPIFFRFFFYVPPDPLQFPSAYVERPVLPLRLSSRCLTFSLPPSFRYDFTANACSPQRATVSPKRKREEHVYGESQKKYK